MEQIIRTRLKDLSQGARIAYVRQLRGITQDELDEFLGYEPKCPNCNNKMIKIVYGMPDTDTMEKAQRGELFLDGCVIEEFQPEYHCNKCRRSYSKNLDEFIEESNNWEDD